jgi:predicted transcriptional regulator
MNVSDKIKAILTATVKSNNISEIASELGLSVQAVTGSLATIKKEKLATYEDKKLVLTVAGMVIVGIKKQKNKDLVSGIVAQNATKLSRPALIKLIASEMNKTVNNAGVYLANYEKANGVKF